MLSLPTLYREWLDMDFNSIMRLISIASCALSAVWVLALLLGALKQLNQIRIDWIASKPFKIPGNPVFDYALRKLGLEQFDRLTCFFGVLVMILAWPLTLVFGRAVFSTIHAHNKQTRIEAR